MSSNPLAAVGIAKKGSLNELMVYATALQVSVELTSIIANNPTTAIDYGLVTGIVKRSTEEGQNIRDIAGEMTKPDTEQMNRLRIFVYG